MIDIAFDMPRAAAVKPGDRITFAGQFVRVPNPNRRWFQFWKPKTITTDQLQEFTLS